METTEIFLEKVIKNFKKIFDKNLICVLLLGSVQKQDTTPFSDLDLVVIIKTFNLNQFKKVRQLVGSSSKILDLSVLCWDEIPKNPDDFRIGTHGSYQLELILKKARCLYGNNILLTFKSPQSKKIKESIVHKAIEYTWWARRMFVESNRERSMANNYQLNSRIIKIMRDLLYLSNNTDIHSTTEVLIEIFLLNFSNILTQQEKDVVLGLANKDLTNQNTANMSNEYFENRINLMNKIYSAILNLYYDNLMYN